MSTRVTCGLLVFCLSVWAVSVRAQHVRTAKADLRWHDDEHAVEGCASLVELESSVSEAVGRSLFDATSPDVIVQVALSDASSTASDMVRGAQDARWRADLIMVSPDGVIIGTRRLTTSEPDCRQLDEMLVLTLALMLDIPLRELQERIRTKRDEQRPPWHVRLLLGGAGSYGWMPDVPFAVRAAVEVDAPRFWPVEVEGAYWFQTDARDGVVTADADAWHVGVATCPALVRSEAFALQACVGAQAGQARAEGHGLSNNQTAQGFALNLVARLSAHVRVAGPFGVRLAAGAGFPIVQHRIVFDDPSGAEVELHEAAPAFGVAELSLAFDLAP